MRQNRPPSEENASCIAKYTVDDALSLIGSGRFQYAILFVTGMIWSTDAIEMMILTFLLPILEDEWNLNNTEVGSIGAVVFAGMLIGAVFWPQISDRFGRRYAILISNLFQIIFGLLSASAWNIYSMMFWRFLTGFCLGAGTCSLTLYAEYAPKENRGKLLTLQQAFWAFGAFCNSILAWIVLETLNWRYYLILSSLPLCLVVYFVWKLPESAHFLVNVGKTKEAETILQQAAKINKSKQIPHPDKLRLIPQQIIHESRGDLRIIFAEQYFNTTITLMITMCVITFAYYGVSFLSERFFDKIAEHNDGNNSDKYWKIVVTASSEIPGVLFGMLVIDRIGRKNNMILCFAICMFCLMDAEMQDSEWLSVILVFIGRGTISMAFFTLLIYFSEYYPTSVRNTALGFASAFSRISGMFATYVSQSDNMVYSFYLLGLASAAGCVAAIALEQDTTELDLSM